MFHRSIGPRCLIKIFYYFHEGFGQNQKDLEKFLKLKKIYYPPIKYFPWYTLTREKTVKTLIPLSDFATDFFLKFYLAFQRMLKDDGIDNFCKKKYIRVCKEFINTSSLDGHCTHKKLCLLPRILIRKFANMILKCQIRAQNNKLDAVNPGEFLRKSSKSFYTSNLKHAPSSASRKWHLGAPAPKVSATGVVTFNKHLIIFL